uniref:Coiled-coil domain-containing protein 85C n=1 Tax=Timema tahoe TaxID=61484 RepID=A0A7R9IJF0_9NEOP|nr:unnamed protein product [Timema tahoe]
MIMSNKKQGYTNRPPIETGAVPPRYQPPPQVSTGPGILKHYQPSRIAFPPAVSKDGKTHPASQNVLTDAAVKTLPQEQGKFCPPPPTVNGESLKPPYPAPPKYPAPPTVIPPPQRRPSAPAGVLARPPEEELSRLAPADMLKFVRKGEGGEAARRVQAYVAEIRSLKEANQRLGDDNQELRDLCCFLDDDRQKGRKLAREWQRFGRYTASVMRQEVSAYQSKLRELDNRQQELIKDNMELKERSQATVCPSCGSGLRPGPRDDGDGSSSSTNADEPTVPAQFARRSDSRERLLEESISRQRTGFNDQMMQYVRSLERRVKQLEEEKVTLQQKVGQSAAPVSEVHSGWDTEGGSRPEAVVQALQVLEVREKIERGNTPEEQQQQHVLETNTAGLDDGEKALVREMCNVVWRKLEEGPGHRR